MKKHNLLYTAYLYEFDVCYKVNYGLYHTSINVISYKGYCDIGYQFTKFIGPKIEKSFHGLDFKFISAEIVDLCPLNW